jgi:cytochrome bd-type quinol oxidase subunit 2
MQTEATRNTNVYPRDGVTGTTGTTTTGSAPSLSRRVSSETKPAYKTTEFLMWVVSVVGVLIAAAVSGTDNHSAAHTDYFRADKAWLYITILTAAYMLARGLAKSGSRRFYDDDQGR